MAERPEVSVVIPTRNRWQRLSRAALPAARGQAGVDVEIIVADDGSDDETPARLHAIADEDVRVRTVRHDVPRGVSGARNAGLRAARGEWVAFLDDDDVWAPSKLEQQLEAARRDDAAFVYAGAVALDERGQVLYTYYFPEPGELADKLLRSAVVPAGASNVLARADVLRDLGGFDERFLHLEDWDLWIRLAATGRPAAVKDVLVGALFHPQNKHALHDQSDELAALIRKHASLDPPRMLTVDELGHARWVASQHSRAGLHRRAAELYVRDAVRHRSPGNIPRALDALLAKRPSAVLARMTTKSPPQARGSRPAWLANYPDLEVSIRA